MCRVAIAWASPADDPVTVAVEKAMYERLAQSGYIVGRSIFIEARGTDGTADRFRQVAAELVALKPDVIVVWSSLGARAFKGETTTIRVVFHAVGLPVELGFAETLRRPGGNMTGVTYEAGHETYGKRLQLLKEAVPRLTRVAVLAVSGDPMSGPAMASVDSAAPSLGIQTHLIEIKSPQELDAAFVNMKKNGAQGVLAVASAFTFIHKQRIADLALAHQLPSIHGHRETVSAGGLMSLGPDLIVMAQQGAVYVEKICRGAKPGELAVEQPSRYALHINLKTAKALGLTIPPSLLLRADQVIE
jgi:putative ABC transport system substrate-binding protein